MAERVFLSARWENIVIITYKVNPKIFETYIPKGFEPDTTNGSAFASLVAFDFMDTRVKGMKFPYHINFPEINLRFYVKNKEKRGVVFIREFVPKFIIAFFANAFYNENYRAIAMSSHLDKNGKISLNHSINFNDKKYQINLEAENKPFMPPVDSTEHFFKEHEWGFGTSKTGESFMYRVEHPFWEVYPITKFEHNFNFSEIYGKKWKNLDNESPYNITFAKGSEIKVYTGRKLE